uniref:DH domain-containing protein n=1 Tax=Arcella intermedia TaxID=1963864 RepID=A0A6B2LB31_9EUKA
MKEILQTEINYNNGLRTIKLVFKQPLMTTSILSPEQITKIFPHSLRAILLSSDRLLAQLKELDIDKDYHFDIGSLFLHMMDETFQQSYKTFIMSYEESSATYKNLLKDNKEFKKFIETSSKKETNNHTLEDYLISIVQRIPQYITLLSSLSLCNPSTSQNHDTILKALNKTKEVAEQINREEKLKLTKKLHIQLGIKEEDIPPERILVHEETVYRDVPPKKKSELANFEPKFKMYIFNDTIALSKMEQNELRGVKFFYPPSTSLSAQEHEEAAIKLSSGRSLHSTIYYCRSKVAQQSIIDSLKLCL